MKIKKINEWDKVVENIFHKLGKKNLILLSGDLGAGKTTLTQFIGKKLKIKEKINSPTFVLSKKYSIKNKDFPFKNLIHIDAYRLKNSHDLELIDFFENLKNKENLIILEWPEQVEEIFKLPALKIKIDYDFETNERNIQF